MFGRSGCPEIKEERLNYKISSNVKHIKSLWTKIFAHFKRLHLSDSDIFDIRLSTEEAIVNAMKYGNKFNEELPVLVDVVVSSNYVQVSVEDKGEGFDHAHIPDPTLNNNIGKTSGRGLYLIAHLMDKVVYNDKGNKVTMTKYIKQGRLSKNGY